MAEKSGFYPSNASAGISNKYKGFDFINVYKNIISNGIFANVGNMLKVESTGGMNIVVKSGEGIFLNQWYVNDEDLPFVIDTDSSNRIDYVVIETNKTASVLKTYARVIKGQSATNPVAPSLIDTDTVKQYPIAKVYVTAGVSTITQSSITDMRGKKPTLWVTGIVDQIDTSTLYDQYQTAFWEWFDNVKETLVTTTLMRKYTGVVYSTSEGQRDFTVPISQYNSVLDILQVHVEGRILRENVDYVKNGLNSVTLTNALPIVGTQVYFEIFKSVDGSDAETYVERLYALEQRVSNSQVTADNGSDKYIIDGSFGAEVLSNGVGFHTLFVPNTITGLPLDTKEWRGWSSFTSANKGYVLLISEDGDVYIINYNNGWGTWKALYQHNKKPLYMASSGNVLASTSGISPTKPLSRCANGWVLHFDGSHYHLPKVRYDGSAWSGQTIYVQCYAAGVSFVKQIIVSDTSITGVDSNAEGNGTNVRLWGITEY
jgi:hypothetical protein